MATILAVDLKKQINELKEKYSPEIFNRATQNFYRKETRWSHEIESEKASPDRKNRFIAILHEAGRRPAAAILEERNLTELHNAIVYPRYSQRGYRDIRNYIGQTNYRTEKMYHYVCPPPEMVRSMLGGMVAVEQKTLNSPSVVRAAMIAFGFVFILPFLDGNGRNTSFSYTWYGK